MADKTSHIALVTAYYPPHLGGVERFTENLADALAAKGNLITVITTTPGYEDALSGSERIHVVSVPACSVMGDRFPLLSLTPTFFRRKKVLEKIKFDSVVINTRYYPICALGCHIAKVAKAKLVLIDHSSGPISTERSLLGIAMRAYERAMNVVIRRNKPIVCSVSRRGLEWLKTIDMDGKTVVHNSIDTDKYLELAADVDWRSKLSIEVDSFVVTYAGRLIAEKGLPKLIEAVDLLNKSGHKVTLVVAGDGSLADPVRMTHHKWLKYVGRLNQSELSSLLRDSDGFCLPTEYPEGLPTVLLEAGAQRCAIVVSDCAGAREVVPDDTFGCVLDVVTPEAIATAIAHFANNPDAARECGIKVSQHIAKRFSWDFSADSLLAALESSE